jgi:hypothetical protein
VKEEYTPQLELITGLWAHIPYAVEGIRDYLQNNLDPDVQDHVLKLQRSEQKIRLLQILGEVLVPKPNGWLRLYEVDKTFRLRILGITPHATKRAEYLVGCCTLQNPNPAATSRMLLRLSKLVPINMPFCQILFRMIQPICHSVTAA